MNTNNNNSSNNNSTNNPRPPMQSPPVGAEPLRNSPGPRPRVRRLSQLEPVHIAALHQEYNSQMREASKENVDNDAKMKHLEKARKIKVLLAKYEQMVKDQKNKQQQDVNGSSTGGQGDSVSPVSSGPTTPSPSISQQMANNVQQQQQYSQFRVQQQQQQQQMDNNNNSTTHSVSPPPVSTGSPSLSSNAFYNKQAQTQTPENLTLQLQRFKQLEKETNDQLISVERTIRESPNIEAELRQKLRGQEQNLRTKRDQYKSMVLTVTQQLQVKKKPPVKQQQQQVQTSQQQQQPQQSQPQQQQSQQQQQQPQQQQQQQQPQIKKEAQKTQQPPGLPVDPSLYSSPGMSINTTPPNAGSSSNVSTPTYSNFVQAGKYAKKTASLPSSSPSIPTSSASLGASSITSTLSSSVLSTPVPSGPTASAMSGASSLNSIPVATTAPKATYQKHTTGPKTTTTKNVRGPGKVGRPPLSATAASAKRAPSTTALNQIGTGSTNTTLSSQLAGGAGSSLANVVPDKVYNKRKIGDLIKSLMPKDMDGSIIEPEVEDIVGDLIDEFVDNVTKFSVRLAKHRKAERVEPKDVHVHLERNWNIRVPGTVGKDEVEIVRKPAVTKSYMAKMDLVNQAKLGNGNKM